MSPATARGCVVVALLLATPVARALAQAPRTPEDSVRAERAASNAAMARQDFEAVAQRLLPDVVTTISSGDVRLGRDSVLATFRQIFGDSTFRGYVRTPTRVEASRVRPHIAEHGEWVGRWQREDGVQSLHGTYLAMWVRTPEGWRIRSELFVVLRCTGSARCTR